MSEEYVAEQQSHYIRARKSYNPREIVKPLYFPDFESWVKCLNYYGNTLNWEINLYVASPSKGKRQPKLKGVTLVSG